MKWSFCSFNHKILYLTIPIKIRVCRKNLNQSDLTVSLVPPGLLAHGWVRGSGLEGGSLFKQGTLHPLCFQKKDKVTSRIASYNNWNGKKSFFGGAPKLLSMFWNSIEIRWICFQYVKVREWEGCVVKIQSRRSYKKQRSFWFLRKIISTREYLEKLATP
jgi:hypothetical protein